MIILLTLISIAGIYRIVRPTLIPAAKRDEDFTARLVAVFSLVALVAAGALMVSYGMGAAMSDGAGAHGTEKAVKVIIFIPAVLACFALARAHSALTVICALPAVIVYFIPALQKNLGL